MTDPRAAYQSRLQERRALLAALEQRHRWLGPARLFTFLVTAVTAWVAATRPAVSVWLILVPVAGFVALVIVHARARLATARATRSVEFFSRGLARLDGAWAGTGRTGEEWIEAGHPFAADLDLFGRGSLFELLSEARTVSGERTLASWLQHPAGPDTIRLRQTAVAELAPRLEFRESLAVLGHEVRSGFDERPLIQWASTEQAPFPPGTLILCRLVVLILLAATAGALAGWWTWTPVLVAGLLVGGVGAALRRRTQEAIAGVGAAARELAELAELVGRLEEEPVEAPFLADLRLRLTAGQVPASVQIWRLRRLIGLLDSRGNQLVMLILPLLLWTTQIAVAISRWRREAGPAVADWIAAVGAFEAVASLAGHAFEHPEAVVPELVAGVGLVTEGLGHPLLKDGGVRNDVRLGAECRLLVVSGSNMSGKSTLLRSVGTAAVMAQMGSVICAKRFLMEPLSLGASISTHDSLQEGRSRFYAEINRLRQILDLAGGERHVLFLLDELLSGTNSHDRRLGAEAVVRRLIADDAIGILTTHDLALARIASDLGAQAANVHFRDELVDGEIAFDYRMHPGVVERGNALALMRSIGIDAVSRKQ